MTEVTAQDIEALVRTFDESDWDELRVVVDGLEIYLSKDPNDRRRSTATVSPVAASAALSPEPTARALARSDGTDARPVADMGAMSEFAAPDGMVVVRAPNLGTFYRAPKPGSPPYVSIGQRVEAETEICLIEVMKLFTPVRAGVAGTVRKVLVEDAQLVEFDQPLFLIEPAA